MKFVSTAIIALAAASAVNAHEIREGNIRKKTRSKDPRIVGGNNADRNEYPYLVNVSGHCGGTLIAPKVILTAAHCDDNYTGKELIVGSAEASGTGQYGKKVKVKEQYVHANYDSNAIENDVKLLLLEEDACMGSFTLDINKDQSVPSAGQTLVASGIGTTSYEGEGSDWVLEVSIPALSHSTCSQYHNVDSNLQVCAGGTPGKDTCQGDSGGPLVVYHSKSHHTLVGVVSYGGAGCGDETPGVYASVAGYYSWMHHQVCSVWNVQADFCDGGVTSCGSSGSGGSSSGGSSSSGCVDEAGWEDDYGDACDWYDAESCEHFGDEVGTNGMKVKDACCVCK